jgi:hypothetical protein
MYFMGFNVIHRLIRLSLQICLYTLVLISTFAVWAAESTARLPDGVVVRGERQIAEAWLIAPTKRYGHAVLGDDIEAGGVRVVLRNGDDLTFYLPSDSVFEDRYPRLYDLDQDREDEVVLVRAYRDRGAALAVLEVSSDGITIGAESAPIGQAYRWLNPAGAGDFDGDGKPELAAVLMPHLSGELAIYQYDGTRLVEEFRGGSYSTHAIGSREMGLSVVMDSNRDGRDELLIPEFGRFDLVLLQLHEGQIQELDRLAHQSPISTSLHGDQAGDVMLVYYHLKDGTKVILEVTGEEQNRFNTRE